MPAGERILLIDHDSNRAAMSAAILGYLGAEAGFESEFPAAIADDAFGLAIVAWSAEFESPEARLAGLREAMPALPLIVVGSCGRRGSHRRTGGREGRGSARGLDGRR